MKLEIVNRRDAVEVRQLNDDGTMTIYLCENPQAAMFKIASLVYSIEEPKEEAKRSILVGTFGEKKKQPERPNLEEIAKKIAEEMEQQQKFTITVPPPFSPPDPFPGAAVPYVNPLGPYAGGQVHIVPCGMGGIGSAEQAEIDVDASKMADSTGSAPSLGGTTIDIDTIISSMHGSKISCFGIQDEELGGENLAMFSAEFGPNAVKLFKTSLHSNT